MTEDRPASYDPAYFSELARLEDRHFWFRARNRLIEGLVRRIVRPLPPGYRALEVGCGNGNVLRRLERACPHGVTIGMDFFREGLQFARQRTGCPLVQGDARHSPFARGFHLIGMFDVLEHLPEDVQALKDVCGLLEPGGVLLLTVPAGRALWSYFDEASRHFRRYERLELGEKIAEAGLELERVSYFMSGIYPLLWMTRRFAQRGRGAREQDPGLLARRELAIVPVVNEVLSLALTLEALWVSRGHGLPWGASLLAVARRPHSG